MISSRYRYLQPGVWEPQVVGGRFSDTSTGKGMLRAASRRPSRHSLGAMLLLGISSASAWTPSITRARCSLSAATALGRAAVGVLPARPRAFTLRHHVASMALKTGIVGLPNVGKSTLFNAIMEETNAEAANYPFCTIEPNIGVVNVPDPRLKVLADINKSQKTIPTTLSFVDIAGLVAGASKGEGLGNQFLANIRECDAIVHVVRCFVDDDIVHVSGSVDPLRDIEVITLELVLADLAQVPSHAELDPIVRAAGSVPATCDSDVKLTDGPTTGVARCCAGRAAHRARAQGRQGQKGGCC